MNRFIIADPKVCIGCKTCMAACSEEHQKEGLQTAPRLRVTENDTVSAPLTCHHCEDAPCAQVCPVNAIVHTNQSIQLNESLCVSCKLCGIACPFGAIEFAGSRPVSTPSQYNTTLAAPAPRDPQSVSSFIDWIAGVRAVAVKCDLCHHNPEGPACRRACPTGAIHLVNRNDLSNASAAKRRHTMAALSPGLPANLSPSDLSQFKKESK